MGGTTLILCIIAWLVGGVWAGRATREKGFGWMEGWIPSLLLSPVFGILYAASLPDRGPPAPAAPSQEGRRRVAAAAPK